MFSLFTVRYNYSRNFPAEIFRSSKNAVLSMLSAFRRVYNLLIFCNIAGFAGLLAGEAIRPPAGGKQFALRLQLIVIAVSRPGGGCR